MKAFKVVYKHGQFIDVENTAEKAKWANDKYGVSK